MKFSICIPNYNYGLYIIDTIQSVLDQDFRDLEIIISDNKSTDNSWDVIKDFALKDNRIVAYQNKVNIGFSGNLDLVSSHASGDYQLLVSSDDLMNEGALSFYDQFLSECGNDRIVFSSTCTRIDENGHTIGTDGPKSKLWLPSDIEANLSNRFGCTIFKVPASEMLKRCLLSFYGPFNFVSTCYSSLDYIEIGGYGGSRMYNPDKWLHWRLLSITDFAYFIDKPLFSYRWHQSNQVSLQNNSATLKYWIDEYRNTFEFEKNTLIRVNLNPEDIINSFIYNVIIKSVFLNIKERNLSLAHRIFDFGKAVYPNNLKLNKYYFYFKILLKLGRIGPFLLNLKSTKS